MVVVWRVRKAPRTFFVGRILGIINSVHLGIRIQTLSCCILQTNKKLHIFLFKRAEYYRTTVTHADWFFGGEDSSTPMMGPNLFCQFPLRNFAKFALTRLADT